jgi:hypothetical protein
MDKTSPFANMNAMEKIPASQNKEFFEAPPQPGTPEFDEAKKEAGVTDWFGAFAQKIEMAQQSGDKVLLENSVRLMEEDAGRAVAKAMENGDMVAAKTVINEVEKFGEEHHLNVKEIIASQRERIVREKKDELEALGEDGVLERVNEMIRSDEPPFNKADASLIFNMANEALKKMQCDTVDDALIVAAIKRNEARPKNNLYVLMDKTGYIGSASKSAKEAVQKLQQAG